MKQISENELEMKKLQSRVENLQLRDFVLEVNREMGIEEGQPNDKILFYALKVMSKALDELVTESLKEGGADKRAIAKARGYLPAYCENTYVKKIKK